MADAPGNSSYVLADQDFTDLPNARYLTASGGLVVQDSGSNQKFNITSTGQLSTLFSYSTPGMIAYDATTGFTSRTFQNGTGINITNPGGQGANPIINVVPSSTKQLVSVYGNGDIITPASTRANLNFTAGSRVSITVLDNTPLADAANITIDADDAAPVDARYILQAPNGSLPSAQALDEISLDGGGLLKVKALDAPLAGVIFKSVNSNDLDPQSAAEADYQGPSVNLATIHGVESLAGVLLQGVSGLTPGVGGFEGLTPGAAGTVLTSQGTGQKVQWSPPPGVENAIVLEDNTDPVLLVNGATLIPMNETTRKDFQVPGAVDFPAGASCRIMGYGSAGWRFPSNAPIDMKVGDQVTVDPIESILPTDSILVYCINPDTGKYKVTVVEGDVNLNN